MAGQVGMSSLIGKLQGLSFHASQALRMEAQVFNTSAFQGFGSRQFHSTAHCLARRKLKGIVVSDKPAKSVVVSVETVFQHHLYRKMLKRRTKYMAHDETDEFKIGDKVWIEEHRPLSAKKRWMVNCSRIITCQKQLFTFTRTPSAVSESCRCALLVILTSISGTGNGFCR